MYGTVMNGYLINRYRFQKGTDFILLKTMILCYNIIFVL